MPHAARQARKILGVSVPVSGSEQAKKVPKERIKTKKFYFSKDSLKGWKFLLEIGRLFNDVIHTVNCHKKNMGFDPEPIQ